MAPANALDRLIEFARGQRDGALARFAASVSAERAFEQRLALLVGYRAEYTARLAASARAGLSAGQLRAFRLFLEKLDLAIAQQRQATHVQAEQRLQRRADWARRELRLQGYSVLRDRRRAVSALRSRRDEQRDSDEQVGRGSARAPKNW